MVVDIIVLKPFIFIIGRLIWGTLGILLKETLGPVLLVLISGPPCPFWLLLWGIPLLSLFVIILLLPLSPPLAFQQSVQPLSDGRGTSSSSVAGLCRLWCS